MNFRRPNGGGRSGRDHGPSRTNSQTERTGDRANERKSWDEPIERPDCELKRQCGNCRFVNTPYDDGLQSKYKSGLKVLKERDVLGRARLLGAHPSLHQLNYRTVAKLAVRPAAPGTQRVAPAPSYVSYEDRNKPITDEPAPAPLPPARFAIGLFARESHRVVDIDSCPLHVREIGRLLPILREELENATEILPYNETDHSGDLRYVIIRGAHLTGELSIVFVSRVGEARSAYKRVINQVRLKGFKISCAFINLNPEKTNAIWGASTEQIFGTEGLRETLCGLNFEIGPQSFFQVNPWQAETIYRRIASLVGPSTRQGVAWDLYSGVGQISLNLAREGYKVLGVEEVSQATQDARKNALRNNLDKSIEFMSGRTEDILTQAPAWASAPEVIVVNPSRRGIDPRVLEAIASRLADNPHCRLIYLSCDVTTLSRDLAVLRDRGARLRQAEAFDMFPQTEEMEWLAVVTR